jgi:aspartate racemase
MKRIGILGGMGAAAGVRFLDLLVKECQRRGARCDVEFPEIVLYSIASSGMDETGITNPKRMRDDLSDGVTLLNDCDVDVILIACNSVHVYHDELQRNSKARIVNMPKLAVAMCPEVFGVICSRSAREATVYPATAMYPTWIDQEQVDDIIERIIGGTTKASDSPTLQTMIKHLFKAGAKKVILGCTELPLILPDIENVIDPARIAIAEVLN